MKLTRVSGFFLIIILAVSCASGPIDIPDNLSPAEMVQRAQEASDRNRYAVSLQYYDAILERFPDETAFVCAAEYEIAFINYKQKKYDISKQKFNSLLERYNTPDEELLPPQFKILSLMILASIEEIETANKPKN